MEQQHNKGKIEGFLAELGRKLDQVMERARQGAEEAKVSEKLDELKHTKDRLEHELHEFVKDDEKWKEVQIHLQGAAQELKRAFETTFTRNKADNQGQTTSYQAQPGSDQQSSSSSWNNSTQDNGGPQGTNNNSGANPGMGSNPY